MIVDDWGTGTSRRDDTAGDTAAVTRKKFPRACRNAKYTSESYTSNDDSDGIPSQPRTWLIENTNEEQSGNPHGQDNF